jgi:hypothetical protein
MKSLVRFFSLLILIGCSNNVGSDSADYEDTSLTQDQEVTESFLNTINYPNLNLDSVFISPKVNTKLKLDILDEDSTRIFKLWFDGKNDTLCIEAHSLAFYPEEDINRDGVNEIGILPGQQTSACRKYFLYNITNGNWKKLAETDTHLPDREKGVNYFSISDEKLKIVSATDSCCCQCECLKFTL